jgi:hypothetical protein
VEGDGVSWSVVTIPLLGTIRTLNADTKCDDERKSPHAWEFCAEHGELVARRRTARAVPGTPVATALEPVGVASSDD